MKYALISYLILNPLFYWLGKDLRVSQEWFFQLSSFVLIIAAMLFENRKTKFDKMNLCIFLMGVWFIVVYIVQDFLGWSICINTLLGIMVYFVVIRTIKIEDFKHISWALMMVCATTTGYLAFQFIGFDARGMAMLNVPGGIAECSIFGLVAIFGGYLAIIMPLFMRWSWVSRIRITIHYGKERLRSRLGRYFGLFWKIMAIFAGIALFAFPVIYSKSTGAILAVVVVTLFFLWFRNRLVCWFAIIPLLVGLYAFVAFYDNPMGMQTSRLNMWAMVIQDIHKKPFGHGLNSFMGDDREGAIRFYKHSFNNKTVRVEKKGDTWKMQVQPTKEFLAESIERGNQRLLDYWDHPHNEFIWLGYEAGFPALILLGFIGYFGWAMFFNSKRSIETVALMASVIGFAVFCSTQFGLHLSRIGHLFPVLAGMLYISIHYPDEDKIDEN